MVRAGGITQPGTLAELRLPPSFVAEHALRTLSYQGSMSPGELSRHWRVPSDVVGEILDGLRAAALVEHDPTGGPAIEGTGRLRLTSAGQARVAGARERTWYAGPLPVAVDALYGVNDASNPLTNRERVRDALALSFLDESSCDGIGQAIAAGAAVAVSGAAHDEQPLLAGALGRALEGNVQLPFALFASGSVVRVFDPRLYVPAKTQQPEGGVDILKSRETASQWVTTPRPTVVVSGGLVTADVIPAFDADARFYLAPAPFRASGGLFAVFDADTSSEALREFAHLWLMPGRGGTGVFRLRSGERIETPWRAATVLFTSSTQALPAPLNTAIAYTIDIAPIAGAQLGGFVAQRMPDGCDDAAADALCAAIGAHAAPTRAAAARAARYLRDRAAYEGAAFTFSERIAREAAEFASSAVAPMEEQQAA